MIPIQTKSTDFHGENGFGNVDFWDPANDVNTLVQKKHAVEIIRDLVMEVRRMIFFIKYYT